jgi:hypothetical protein
MLPAPLFPWALGFDALVAPAMTDTPPDHLSIDPSSPFFDQPTLERGIGIRFKGIERNDVEEYSISEGWIRVALGKKVDRRGRPLTIKLVGPVEAYFQTGGDETAEAQSGSEQDEKA